MTGLKLAALFIIHKNIKQAERLLRFFHRETAECFVHIDRKYSCNFENVRRHLESQENVHVLDERLSGTLADWSLVKITMLLVHIMGCFPDRIIRLSHGDSFRRHSNRVIH